MYVFILTLKVEGWGTGRIRKGDATCNFVPTLIIKRKWNKVYF